jgi:hypothetical protein
MNRAEFVKAIKKHGWEVKLRFDGKGPFLTISGTVNGLPFRFNHRVPVRLNDDHGPSAEAFYSNIAAFLISKNQLSQFFETRTS